LELNWDETAASPPGLTVTFPVYFVPANIAVFFLGSSVLVTATVFGAPNMLDVGGRKSN
jgi:hypothetical protein